MCPALAGPSHIYFDFTGQGRAAMDKVMPPAGHENWNRFSTPLRAIVTPLRTMDITVFEGGTYSPDMALGGRI